MATHTHQVPSKRIPAWESIENEECWQSSLASPVDRLSAMYTLAKLTDLTVTFPGHQEKFKCNAYKNRRFLLESACAKSIQSPLAFVCNNHLGVKPSVVYSKKWYVSYQVGLLSVISQYEVHRLVLAMSSPVFECMLFGPMAEGEELKLPADPPEAFKWLMQYMYSGNTSLPDVKTAVMVFHLANKYQMKALCTVCSMYLQKKVNGNNLPLIYDTSILLEDAALEEKCNKVLRTSAELTLSSSDIGLLSRASVKHLLQQDLGVISETSVFKGLVNWASAQGNQYPDKFNAKASLRQEIEEFLPYVRFLAMTVDEYIENVMPSDILTSDESAAILMNIKKVKEVPLPLVCSQKGRRRTPFDKAEIHIVSLWQDYNYYPHSQHATDTRLQLISNLVVSKDIYLGNFQLRFPQNLAFQRWRLEVTESNGDLLREVVCNGSQYSQPGNVFYTTEIKAVLDVPVLMLSGKVYSVWLHCMSQEYACNNFTAQYKNLSISGYYHFGAISEIGFWCFDDTL